MVEVMREAFNGVKVFSATKARERDRLGDRVTEWMRDHKECEITDTCVRQSSDAEFHCLTILVFYWDHSRERP
jgi:hypothetical protein